MKSDSASKNVEATEFVCFITNARSIQTEERFEEMLCELDGLTWDVILINETYEKSRSKY